MLNCKSKAVVTTNKFQDLNYEGIVVCVCVGVCPRTKVSRARFQTKSSE